MVFEARAAGVWRQKERKGLGKRQGLISGSGLARRLPRMAGMWSAIPTAGCGECSGTLATLARVSGAELGPTALLVQDETLLPPCPRTCPSALFRSVCPSGHGSGRTFVVVCVLLCC